jgi:glycosyltransferase involved in cell wall biosynthesis
VVFITGRDIVAEGKGGLSGYVRIHALAARNLGYRTHVFFMGDRDESRDTAYGRLHMVRNPAIPDRLMRVRNDTYRQGFIEGFINSFLKTSYTARLHGRLLASAIRRFVLDSEGPVVIHSFFLWGSVACRVRDELAVEGIRVKVVNSVFATMRHEIEGKVGGAWRSGKLSNLFSTIVEWLWMRLFGLGSERRSLYSPDLLLYNYDSVRRLFEADYGVIPRSRMISYTTEAAILGQSAGEGLPRSPIMGNAVPVVASVSRHDPRKGVDTLIKALAILDSRRVAFRASIGSGGMLLPWHKHLTEELGLGGKVLFTDWLEDPGELYRACDVFVLPSLEEGSGSVSLLEAMMHGNCVVASGIDGIPEDIRDGIDGLLVPPADPVALADALQSVLSDAGLRRALGEAARRRFMERFDPEVFARELGEAYGEG